MPNSRLPFSKSVRHLAAAIQTLKRQRPRYLPRGDERWSPPRKSSYPRRFRTITRHPQGGPKSVLESDSYSVRIVSNPKVFKLIPDSGLL